MSMDKDFEYDFNAIIVRMMEAKGWKNEKDVAGALGMKPVAFSGRKARNSPPIDKIRIWCLSESINPNWVLTGEGEMHVTPITGTSKERLSFSEKSVGDVGESPHDQTIRQRLGSYNYSPEVWAMADFLDLMTKNMTAEEREAFARELFEDTVRKLRAGQK